MKQIDYTESEAAQYNITMEDVYRAMKRMGYTTEELTGYFDHYGMETTNVTDALKQLGLTGQQIAYVLGQIKEETDKSTESIKQQVSEIGKFSDAYKGLSTSAASTYAANKARLASGEKLTESDILSVNRQWDAAAIELSSRTGKSFDEARREVMRESGVALPSYQTGGIVENTGLAYLHEGERIIPSNEPMGIVVNFTQPVFFDREDTMNRFVDMIRKGIQRQDRLRFGGAYNG